jgi:hypothetical protein
MSGAPITNPGGGGTNTDQTAPPATPATPEVPTAPATPPATPADKTFTQADLDRIAAKARDEGREAAQKVQRDTDAETKRLAAAAQGQWKEVADTLETTISELKPKAELAEKLAPRVNASIDAETKDWPEAVKKSDPGVSDTLARITWADNMRDLATQLKAAGGAPNTQMGGGRPSAVGGIPQAGAGGAGTGTFDPVAQLRTKYARPTK